MYLCRYCLRQIEFCNTSKTNKACIKTMGSLHLSTENVFREIPDAAALFYCTALAPCLFNLRSTNTLWINLLGFLLAMLMRGLSATFACLFPYGPQTNNPRTHVRLLPYL